MTSTFTSIATVASVVALLGGCGGAAATTATGTGAGTAADPAATGADDPGAVTTARYAVQQLTLEAQPAMARRATAMGDELGSTVQDTVMSLIGFSAAEHVEVAGPPFVRYLDRFDDGAVMVEIGVPVTRAATGKGDIVATELPAGPAAMVVHDGPFDGLPDAQAALERWLTDQGRHAAGPTWAVIDTDPATTPVGDATRAKVFVPLAP